MRSAFIVTDCVKKKFENVALCNTRKAFHMVLTHRRRTGFCHKVKIGDFQGWAD